MYNTKMYGLGNQRSVIRDLFEYGLQQAEKVGRENIYDYSLGNPYVPTPEAVRQEAIRILQEEDPVALHGYTVAAGDMASRKKLVAEMNKRFGTAYRPEHVFMTCGAAPALVTCFYALTSSSEDEIIAIAPYFPEYKVFVESAGAKLTVVEPDYDTFEINFADFASKINEHTIAVIVNSPNNPSGMVYSAEAIQKAADILRAKEAEYGHPIYIISDEPYREIVFDGMEVPVISKLYADTIVTYSFSKSLSLPGERIGYIVVPDECADSDAIYTCVAGAARAIGHCCAPSLFQRVVANCAETRCDMTQYLVNRDLLYKNLTAMGFECVYPRGAFYLFVKALEADDVAFINKAKELNLLIVPGSGFGAPGYVRLAYCVDQAMIERSLPAFEKLAELYK